MISRNELVQGLGDLLEGPTPDGFIDFDPGDVSTDSRTIAPGQWFVPLVGENFDGHRFVLDCSSRGAAFFLYEKSRLPKGADSLAIERGIAVRDTTKALQAIASLWRRKNPRIKIVGITGSAGKTTTKALLTAALERVGSVHAAKGSFNNELGVPLTLLSMNESDRFCILEFGARHSGDIRFLTELATPDVGCLLNVGLAHVGEFGSVEKLLATKTEIFRYLPEGRTQVASADDPRIMEAARKTNKKTVSFGYDEGSDIRICEEEWDSRGLSLRFSVKGLGAQEEEFACTIPEGNEAYGRNIAATLACARALGVSISEISGCFDSFSPPEGRYRRYEVSGKTLIDDCYNANPASMSVGLTSVARGFSGKPLCFVLGDMLELGDASESEHRAVGAKLSEIPGLKLLLTVGPDARYISEEAKEHGFTGKIGHYPRVEDLIPEFSETANGAEVIYVKGSNGIGLSKLVKSIQDRSGA